MEGRKTKVQWSDLPKELWTMIGKRLDNRLDIPRFRSVCKLWRSSVSPSEKTIIPFLPHTFSNSSDAMADGSKFKVVLFQITVYRMESRVDEEPNSPKGSKPWLLKLEESGSGALRLLHPISNAPLRYSRHADASLKHFNLSDFGIVELRKSYSINYPPNNPLWDRVNKVVAMEDPSPTNLDGFSVLIIYKEGKLGFLRCGDEKWTRVGDEENSEYDDIIVYKGQFYVVDSCGTVSWVNSELKLIQFSPPLRGAVHGQEKHLVESCGDLYMVDQYTGMFSSGSEGDFSEDDDSIFGCHAKYSRFHVAFDFKVYKLDQEWGRWVDVKNLGDQVFILSNDGSFCVSAGAFDDGVKGNCILFTDQRLACLPLRPESESEASGFCRVFNLEDGSIRHLPALAGYYQMVRPPSTWLTLDRSCPSAC